MGTRHLFTYLLTLSACAGCESAGDGRTREFGARELAHDGAARFAAVDASPSGEAADGFRAPTMPIAAAVRDDGAKLAAEPIPFGMYHVSWMGRTGATLAADVATIGASGMGFLHPSLDLGELDFLEVARSQRVKLIPEFPWAQVDTVVARLADESSIVGWNIGDDINWASPGCEGAVRLPADEARARTARVRALDADAFSYASAVGDCPVGDYVGAIDVIGIQSYPVGQALRPLHAHARTLARVEAELHGERQLYWANIQAFAWEDGRFPSAEEARNMAYVALVHGASGILAYTFDAGSGSLPEDHPALWKGLVATAAEIRDLSPRLREPRTRIPTTDSLCAARFGTATVLITALDEASDVDIALEGSRAEVLVGPDGWTLGEGRLRGRLGASEVVVLNVQ